MSKQRKKRGPIRRAVRLIALLIVAALLYSIVCGYAPFVHPPKLGDESALLARADEMQRDVETADRAAILESRGQALDERIRLLNQAQRDIVITTYDCRDSESVRDILCVALERADAGVRVRMLVDGISGPLMLAGKALFKAIEAHPNMELRFYNPLSPLTPWRHMGRMHDKYVIVDDFGYILGGRNMFDHFLGEYISPTDTYSNDREALVYCAESGGESSLNQVLDYFEGMWSHQYTVHFTGKAPSDDERDRVYAMLRERREALMAEKPELFAPADYEGMTLPTKGIWLISNPTGIYAKQPVVFTQLCALMETAERDIVIHSPYVALNKAMRERLSRIASRTPTTLMINAVENGANVVASGDYLYHRGEVLSTGMQVLEHAGGDSYHGKAVAIDDDISVIGSFNLDLRSTYVDTELMLVIRGEAFNAQLRRNMEALHADSRRVIDEKTSETPQGLTIPPLPLWKEVAMRIVGGAMQLVRNLV